MNFELFSLCCLVFLAKVCEVSIQSVKTVCMVKGQRWVAGLLAFIECAVWGLIISSIITSLSDNFALLIAYCLGYSMGIIAGSYIENAIALGTSNIQLMVNNNHVEVLRNYFMENNRGFVALNGTGARDDMNVIFVVLPRREVKKTISEIRNLCNNEVFVISSEVSRFVGGYGVRK